MKSRCRMRFRHKLGAGVALYGGMMMVFLHMRLFSSLPSLEDVSLTAPTRIGKSICFVTAAYAHNVSSVDRILPARFAPHEAKHFLFTNLPNLVVAGWEPIRLHFLSQYKSFITQSRYGKFMGWQVPQIQDSCHTVFYVDGSVNVVGRISSFESLATQIQDPQGPGWMQNFHPKRTGGIMDELKAILLQRKDSPERILKTLRWLQSQDDFDPVHSKVYVNTYFGYTVPPSPSYKRQATDFWAVFSQEELTWRDQPLWSYFIQKYGVTPLPVPFLYSWSFLSDNNAKGFNGHRYHSGGSGHSDQIYTLAFLAPNPSLEQFRLRGHQIVDQINSNAMNRAANNYTFLASAHQCGELASFCPDICIHLGPCHNPVWNTNCCGMTIVDMSDKYFDFKTVIDSNRRTYDGIIVNSESAKVYFRDEMQYEGDIQVLHHHSYPRLAQRVTTTNLPVPANAYQIYLERLVASSINGVPSYQDRRKQSPLWKKQLNSFARQSKPLWNKIKKAYVEHV